MAKLDATKMKDWEIAEAAGEEMSPEAPAAEASAEQQEETTEEPEEAQTDGEG